ncbi:MAG TPA: LemA family protein [Mycobacteriales bacterium]|nr:LemA family protein [Mycobacteriales bacterium]
MDPIVIAVIVAVALLIFSVIASYNRFHKQRNVVQESWRQVDVELRRRYDLIPNLVETARTFAVHERQVLEAVTAARANAAAPSRSVADQANDENQLTMAVRQLFAVAENYPQLKADQNFLALQHQLAETEDRIAAGRRFYNSNVRAYNTRIDTFPSSVIANFANFEKAEYFEVADPVVREPVRVDFGGQTGQPPAAPPAAPTA